MESRSQPVEQARPAARGMPRRGATMVETAIVMVVFLTIVLGMLDLGVAVLRYHMLCNAAREACREAIVHGSLATQLGSWGPATVSCQADAGNPIALEVAQRLPSLDHGDVHVEAAWIDGGNDPMAEHRVRITLTANYTPTALFLFNQSILLRAQTTMKIVH